MNPPQVQEISRQQSVRDIRQTYIRLVGGVVPEKKENETYDSYKNKLINRLLEVPNVKLRFGERISKNKPSDRVVGGRKTGRPRTSGRERVCQIVAKGKNTNRVSEQNYECKGQVEEKKYDDGVEEIITLRQLENIDINILRRIATHLIPTRRRNKQFLTDTYQVTTMNQLNKNQLFDLLRRSGITEISQSDAIKVILKN